MRANQIHQKAGTVGAAEQ